VERIIGKQFSSFGYEEIQTPMFEFFEVFSSEIGTTPSKDLFKFFDGEGNTLVLRPDFTPSMARCAAKYFGKSKEPLRFCYQGNTYANTSSLQGKLKEVTEMGTELIGDDGLAADGEMIALVIESLLAVGLEEFQISIGQVDYFKGMCAQTGISAETEFELREFISGKNILGAEDLLKAAGIPEEHRNQLLQITDLFGTVEVLRKAEAQADNEQSKAAVKRLTSLYHVLCDYRVDKYVAFDLGMLSKYEYYTGIIFKCYAYGVGDVIAKGGRYDNLLAKFGKASPAIGFGIVIDDLMAALERQRVKIPKHDVTIIHYDNDNFEDALAEARVRRKEGNRVVLNRKKIKQRDFDNE
jgi:ATP phosphoribosyltransferase regulatory subunit